MSQPAERVRAFLEFWQQDNHKGDVIYSLGRNDEIRDLTVTDLLALLPSRFNPTEEDARALVAAANQRAESIAQRLMEAQRYATDKGDMELARRLSIPEPHISFVGSSDA